MCELLGAAPTSDPQSMSPRSWPILPCGGCDVTPSSREEAALEKNGERAEKQNNYMREGVNQEIAFGLGNSSV